MVIHPDSMTEHSGALRAYRVPIHRKALANFRRGKKLWLRIYPGGCSWGSDVIEEIRTFEITKKATPN